MIDFLSDTVTRPTPAMRQAMADAVVGDDGYGEDPTVNALEAKAAALLGKEAACFMPSGIMANLCAVVAHCPRGYEVIVGDDSDLYNYEAGGVSVVGGLVLHPVPTQPTGELSLQDLEAAVRDQDDHQCARVGVVCVENPHCRTGGRVLPLSYMDDVRAFADRHGIPLHLDGARIFTAAVALGIDVSEIAKRADSIQFCLSKNLAAPIGSMLVGDARFMDEARRLRKMLGGSMRQAGVVAAAGLVALEEMVGRLHEDHARARTLGEGLAAIDGVHVDLEEVQTNMVFFKVTSDAVDQADFLKTLKARGIRMAELGHGRVRAVVHYEISDGDIETTLNTIRDLVGAGA